MAKTGIAVAEVLRAEGTAVTVIDDAAPGSVAPQRLDQLGALGAGFEAMPTPSRIAELVDACDFVVPSPGVRPNHAAIAGAIAMSRPVRSEIDLAAERMTFPMIAVTGTNGKTTTVELIEAMLVETGLRARSAGNIGTPLISIVHDPLDVVVAEVSSFQLEFTTSAFRPRVAVLLNVADDHLDWHGSFAGYVAAKARIGTYQTPDDFFVVNRDDSTAARVAEAMPAQRIAVTLSASDGYGVRDAVLVADDVPLMATNELPRALPHDVTNSLCAAAAVFAFADATGRARDRAAVVSALKKYETLPHRVQFIGENLGVRYYNDSKATNPHATLRAVDAFDSVVLLAGGLNKGLDLAALRDAAPRVRAVVAFGAAASEVAASFEGLRPVTTASGMRDAVRQAREVARDGDVVLLSPGCASFDMYPGGYPERGDDFAAEVRDLIAEEQAS